MNVSEWASRENRLKMVRIYCTDYFICRVSNFRRTIVRKLSNENIYFVIFGKLRQNVDGSLRFCSGFLFFKRNIFVDTPACSRYLKLAVENEKRAFFLHEMPFYRSSNHFTLRTMSQDTPCILLCFKYILGAY